MLQVEPGRRHVFIAGSVVDDFTNKAVAGAIVRIIEAPEAFTRRFIIPARQVWLGAPPTLADPQAALDHARSVLKDPLAKLRDRVLEARSVFNNPLATHADEYSAAQAVLDYQDSRGETIAKRADQTSTATDGSFFFVTSREKELFNGDYVLRAWLPGAGSRFKEVKEPISVQMQVPVPVPVPMPKPLPVPTIQLRLLPTGLTGRIVDAVTNEGIDMAEVRVEGSGEFTFSDSDSDPQKSGAYRLIGLETGTPNAPRRVRVIAQGYEPDPFPFVLEYGVVKINQDILLTK